MGGLRLAAALLGLLLAGAASAQNLEVSEGLEQVLEEGSIEINADFLEYERGRGLYTARGNVVVRQTDRTIRADWVSFNQLTGVGVASGNVTVEENGNILRASFIEFDVFGVRGVVRDGSFESTTSQFRATGKVIEKTGTDRYAFTEGVFTTCRCPDEDDTDPWQIKAEEAEVEIGGYAVVEDTTVEIMGIPVAWMPWMIYPVLTERQSGVLLPEVEYSNRNGAQVGLPIFLALHDQVNLTLTPGYGTKRGVRARTDVEYVLGEKSFGNVTGVYEHDISLDQAQGQHADPFRRDRYSVEGAKGLHLPAGLRFTSRFDVVSDNQVPLDFNEMQNQRADRRLIAQGFLSRAFGTSDRFGVAALARFSDDMQNPDDRDRDDTTQQRLPGGELALLPGDVPWLPRIITSMDADYAYFWHDDDRTQLYPTHLSSSGDFLDLGVDGVASGYFAQGMPRTDERVGRNAAPELDPHGDDFDANLNRSGTEFDDRFQEGETLIDKGHRLWLHPRIAAPFQAGSYVEVYPEVGWNQTLYDTEVHNFEQRGFFTARVDARTRLSRQVGEFTHVIEPLLGWALALTPGQDGNPLFVPRTALEQTRVRALDLDSVVRDDADRIPSANRASFGVANRLLGDGRAQTAELTLLGLYDFEESRMDLLVADARLKSSWGARGRVQLGFDPTDGVLDESLLEVGWRHQSGLEASLRYRFLRDIPDTFEEFTWGNRWDDSRIYERIHQLRGEFRVPVTRQWMLGYRGAFSFERNQLLSSAASVEYFSMCGCWSAGLEFSGDIVSGVGVRVLYSLGGFGLEDLPGDDAGVLDGL
jgi:LPS-assembly protein